MSWKLTGFDPVTGELLEEHELPDHVTDEAIQRFFDDYSDVREGELSLPAKLVDDFARMCGLEVRSGVEHFVGYTKDSTS